MEITGKFLRGLAPGVWLLFAMLAGAGFARDPGIDQRKAYDSCVTLAQIKPGEALESAADWAKSGAGDAAGHCMAVALVALGRYEAAARRLDRLARRVAPERPDLRRDLLVQSGQAWLLAGDTRRARGAQTAALQLAPDNVELLIDRSITLAAAADYRGALDDLNRALTLAPERSDVLVLRASAHRHLAAHDLARDDLERALSTDPNDPAGLLERGILRHAAGDFAGARADWRNVLDLGKGSPAAEAARANLARLEGEGG